MNTGEEYKIVGKKKHTATRKKSKVAQRATTKDLKGICISYFWDSDPRVNSKENYENSAFLDLDVPHSLI